jgi:hypothetical protein
MIKIGRQRGLSALRIDLPKILNLREVISFHNHHFPPNNFSARPSIETYFLIISSAISSADLFLTPVEIKILRSSPSLRLFAPCSLSLPPECCYANFEDELFFIL